MNVAIHFNNQGSTGADKVDDKTVDRNLAAKAMPTQLAIAQPLPEQVFGRGGLMAHLPGNCPQFSSEHGILARIMFSHRSPSA